MNLCTHVCFYACAYAFMHACMHVSMYACMYVCMYACMFMCLCVCMYVRVHVCMHGLFDAGDSGADPCHMTADEFDAFFEALPGGDAVYAPRLVQFWSLFVVCVCVCVCVRVCLFENPFKSRDTHIRCPDLTNEKQLYPPPSLSSPLPPHQHPLTSVLPASEFIIRSIVRRTIWNGQVP